MELHLKSLGCSWEIFSQNIRYKVERLPCCLEKGHSMGKVITLVSVTVLSLLLRSKQTTVQILRDVSTNAALLPVSALLHISPGWTMRQRNAVRRPYLLPNHLSSPPALVS